jgi:hypothetical protein
MTWYHRVHTEWQLPRFGVYIPSWWKISPAWWEWWVHIHLVQSCGVRSSWEGRYTPPISTLPLYVLFDWTVSLHVTLDTYITEETETRGSHIEMSSIFADQRRPRIWAQMRGEGGGGGGVSANEYSCAHGAQINFGDLTPYLTYGRAQAKYALLLDNETHPPSSFHVGLLRRGNSW